MSSYRGDIRAHGFSLTELAVTLLIASLLFGGLLPSFKAQLQLVRMRDTDRALQEIVDALVSHAIAHGQLPCPADPAGGTGKALIAAGTTQACELLRGTIASGAIPFAELGLPSADVWGNKYSYWVDASWTGPGQVRCASVRIPPPSFCAEASASSLEVHTRLDTGAPTSRVATEVVAVVVAHGRNGRHGWSARGAKLPDNPGRNPDEGFNDLTRAVTPTPVVLLAREPSAGATVCDDAAPGGARCDFDHQLVFLSKNLMLARLVAARSLP